MTGLNEQVSGYAAVQLADTAETAGYKRGLLRAAELAREAAQQWQNGADETVSSEATALLNHAAKCRAIAEGNET